MLSILGPKGRLCDSPSRREFLRVGGSAMLGLSLPNILALEANASTSNPVTTTHSNGFGKAKSVIFLFLQGGPSHIDLWDPKPDAPANIRGEFKPIATSVPGISLTEVLPRLAGQIDKCTLIRSLSYSPNGLLNHTAAMYQMLTGYTPDKVSPSGQLEPPSPNDFPNVGCNIIKLRPLDQPMLPFVMLPRAPQESNVIGKAGTAGFLGKAYDPYYLYPPGADTDPIALDKIKIDDLMLRQEVTKVRLRRRQDLLKAVNNAMPELEEAVSPYALDKYYGKAFDLILSGRARQAFDLKEETDKVRDAYGRHVFGQSCLLARRLVEAGTRFVQVNWPSVANADPKTTSWDTHFSNFPSLKNLHGPKLDSALPTLLSDLHERGLLEETLVVAVGEFGRSPRLGAFTSGNFNTPDGRDHWPYCYTALVAGAGVRGGALYGRSDAQASAPKDLPVRPEDILATVYHSIGIDPGTIVYNHLNQPRELVKGTALTGLY